MQSRPLLYVAAILALIGLAVNVGVDLDNVYDMTTVALWVLTLIFVVVAAAMKPKPAAPSAAKP
jgi:hypothetical protein